MERKSKMERIGDPTRLERLDASPGGTPTQDSNHGDIDMRLSTTSQSIQSVVAVASNIPNNQTGPFPPKRRCRDFDGKSSLFIDFFFFSVYLINLSNQPLNYRERLLYAW